MYDRSIDRRSGAGIIRRLDDLGAVRDEWNELHRRLPHPSPLSSYEYARLRYRMFFDPEQVRLFLITEGNRTLGLAPMLLQKEHGLKLLTPLTNPFCLHGEPVVKPQHTAEFAHELTLRLIDDADEWDEIDQKFTYSFDYQQPILDSKILEDHHLRTVSRSEPTYIVRLDQSFNDYWGHILSKQMRKTIRRSRRKLEKKGDLRYVHYRGEEAVKLWPTFVDLEHSGWKGRNRSSIAASGEATRRYHEEFVRLLARYDALHLFFLMLNNKPIAGRFGYVDNCIIHSAKTAYDENFRKESPSHLLFASIVEDLTTNFSYLTKLHLFPWDSGHKYRLASHDAEVYETLVFNHSLRGAIAGSVISLKERLKAYPSLKKIVEKMPLH